LKKLGEKETISSRVPPRRPIEEINVWYLKNILN
jgi:hypothetical protein